MSKLGTATTVKLPYSILNESTKKFERGFLELQIRFDQSMLKIKSRMEFGYNTLYTSSVVGYYSLMNFDSYTVSGPYKSIRPSTKDD